jgi:hypothetical protein
MAESLALATRTENTMATEKNEPFVFVMVITLKSGTQIRQRVTGYRIERCPLTRELSQVEWALHRFSQVKITELNLGEVAAIHSEYPPGGPR